MSNSSNLPNATHPQGCSAADPPQPPPLRKQPSDRPPLVELPGSSSDAAGHAAAITTMVVQNALSTIEMLDMKAEHELARKMTPEELNERYKHAYWMQDPEAVTDTIDIPYLNLPQNLRDGIAYMGDYRDNGYSLEVPLSTLIDMTNSKKDLYVRPEARRNYTDRFRIEYDISVRDPLVAAFMLEATDWDPRLRSQLLLANWITHMATNGEESAERWLKECQALRAPDWIFDERWIEWTRLGLHNRLLRDGGNDCRTWSDRYAAYEEWKNCKASESAHEGCLVHHSEDTTLATPLQLLNGATFSGQTKTITVLHGPGTYTFSDGSTFEGEWQDGKRHGNGTVKRPDGTVLYDGGWKEGMYHGQGTLTTRGNGDYVGQWKEGQRDCQGTEKWPNGTVLYEGQWKEGQHDGQGTYNCDGIVYEGQWKEGDYHGQGTETRPNGTVYEGQWKEGNYHGKGTQTLPDGTVYEGQFQEGKAHGKGTETLSDGTVKEGVWKDDGYVGAVNPKTQDEFLRQVAADNYGLLSPTEANKHAYSAMIEYNKTQDEGKKIQHKKGQPLPDGFFIVKISDKGGVIGSLAILVDAITRMRLYNDPTAIVPYERGSGHIRVFRGELALRTRREVAKKLTPEMVAKMRRPVDVEKPEWSLMKFLSDAGLNICPASGTPVFDPSSCSDTLRKDIWRAYAEIAVTIKTKKVGGAPSALRTLNDHIIEEFKEEETEEPPRQRARLE